MKCTVYIYNRLMFSSSFPAWVRILDRPPGGVTVSQHQLVEADSLAAAWIQASYFQGGWIC